MPIIIKPITTEKTRVTSEKLRQYAFRVLKNANKLSIKEAVEDLYNVQVESVNTLIIPPKQKQRYTKSGLQIGAKQGFKKAIVTLKEGNEINFYTNI